MVSPLESTALYKLGPLAGDPEIGVVDTPGAIRPAQFRSATPTEFRRVTLNPAPDGNVIHMHVLFCHNLFQISQAQRVSKITTNGQNDDLRFEMSSFE